jgi:hypothetical protein
MAKLPLIVFMVISNFTEKHGETLAQLRALLRAFLANRP